MMLLCWTPSRGSFYDNIIMSISPPVDVTRWPSGLRRYVKAVVFTGVGSNPTRVKVLFLEDEVLLLFCS